METIYLTTRYLHITAGIIAFLVAPVALIAKKGSSTHRFWGKVFFWAMIVIACTAAPMALYNPNMFLFLIAIFSLHLSLSGYRASVARKTKNPTQSRLIDTGIATGSLLVYIVLTGWGFYSILSAADMAFGIIAILFGMIGLRFSISQLQQLNKPTSGKMDWWFGHMQGMLGAYIATVSAFSAVNFYFLPPVIRWLWPTVIGSIGISLWVRYYKKKFKTTSANTAVAT